MHAYLPVTYKLMPNPQLQFHNFVKLPYQKTKKCQAIAGIASFCVCIQTRDLRVYPTPELPLTCRCLACAIRTLSLCSVQECGLPPM